MIYQFNVLYYFCFIAVAWVMDSPEVYKQYDSLIIDEWNLTMVNLIQIGESKGLKQGYQTLTKNFP